MSRLKQMTADGIKDVATAERFKGGVSGAYTPMRPTKNFPGYIEWVDRLRAQINRRNCMRFRQPSVRYVRLGRDV